MGLLSILPPRRRTASLRSLVLLGLLPVAIARSQTLATTVPLVLPTAIAFDTQGNLYIAETARHVVRKVDSAGNITTVAGTGTQGFDGDGGSAASALLDSPQGLAVDANGLYIADSHNHRVRRVDLASGAISTIAGDSTAGSRGDSGPAASASLDLPTALALDGKGALYIADAGSHRIRRIDATGTITTVVGTGTQGFAGDGAAATAALLDSPGGIAVDAAGNLYVADTHNQRVRKIDASTGAITTLAGNGALGYADAAYASSARLALPRGLSLDQRGNVYIADSANHRIRRVDGTTGAVTTVAGDGTQGFAGDGGAPTAASLDSPRSTANSPAAAVTLADTGNARVRQIAGTPLQTGASLQTVAGLGATTPGVLALAGPSVVFYGTGHITATLSTSSATGSITFLDSYAGATSTIAAAPLASNTASLDTSTLAAGEHAITATYVGDQAHASAQSPVFALTISPAPVSASLVPDSVVYGQPVPALTGTLDGLLPRDQAKVSATLSTTAGTLSPVGSYPVSVALTGPASQNYVLASAPSFAVTKAATATTLAATAAQLVNGASGITVEAGQVVTLTAHIASTTSGTPTGTVTILDGASIIGTATANASGDTILSTSTLSAGAHSFTAVYSGDGNFTASTSSPALITVDAPPTGAADFTLATNGAATQTIIAGNSTSFTFTLQPQPGLSSQISLAAAGLPNLATASFNPAYVPPGAALTTVTLTIATPRSALVERHSNVAFALMLSPFAAGLLLRLRKGRAIALLSTLLLISPLLVVAGCGDRIYSGAYATQASKTYTITVTGTATSAAGSAIQHAAKVTLVVAPAN